MHHFIFDPEGVSTELSRSPFLSLWYITGWTHDLCLCSSNPEANGDGHHLTYHTLVKHSVKSAFKIFNKELLPKLPMSYFYLRNIWENIFGLNY